MSLGNPMYAMPKEPPHDSDYRYDDYEPERPVRTSRAVALTLLLLTVLGLAAIYYGRLSFAQIRAELAQVTSIKEAFEGVKPAWEKTQKDIAAWAGETEGLRDRLNKFETTVTENVRRARAHAEQIVAEAGAQISADTNAKLQAVEGRLQGLETQQSAQAERLSNVEQQAQAVEKQVHTEMAALRQETKQGMSGLATRVDGNARQFELLDTRTGLQRVDFELPRGRALDMIPGVSVQVSGVNVSRQQFDARVKLVEEKHTLAVQAQSAYQPVRFYSRRLDQPYELVVTDMGKDFVVGYVLVPVRAGELRTDAGNSGSAGGKTRAGSK